jgi:hypothetical protein
MGTFFYTATPIITLWSRGGSSVRLCCFLCKSVNNSHVSFALRGLWQKKRKKILGRQGGGSPRVRSFDAVDPSGFGCIAASLRIGLPMPCPDRYSRTRIGVVGSQPMTPGSKTSSGEENQSPFYQLPRHCVDHRIHDGTTLPGFSCLSTER